jgi:hypothetical protein
MTDRTGCELAVRLTGIRCDPDGTLYIIPRTPYFFLL